MVCDACAQVEYRCQDRVAGALGEQGEKLGVRGGLAVPPEVLRDQAGLLDAVLHLLQLPGGQPPADGPDGRCLDRDQPVVHALFLTRGAAGVARVLRRSSSVRPPHTP
jgi:hypothetical protein